MGGMHVRALFRHPVKGLTPEPLERLTVQDDGRVAGDRVLAFRFASAAEPERREDGAYWPKRRGLALMDVPSLARLRLRFDPHTLRLRIEEDRTLLVEDDLSDEGRRRIEDAVTGWMLAGPDAKHLAADGALPLRLVGDGRTSRFQDRPRGYVSLHGAASVAAVDAAAPAPVDDRRFRSNIVVDGTAPWEELDWTGRVRVGAIEFEVVKRIGRCAAIMANPDTGVRDARLMRLLTTAFSQTEPTLGILLLPVAGGGEIRVGDPVTVTAGEPVELPVD
ncbi:MOSC domain-containing protein [Microbacterium sp. GXF7504]